MVQSGRWDLPLLEATSLTVRRDSGRIMSLLTIIYWVVVVLWAFGSFFTGSWKGAEYVGPGAALLLFILIGLKSFRTPIA